MIVICTPTGQIGRQTLTRVLDSGAKVRVIARDPSRIAPEDRERVEVVQGSLADADVLNEAFAGAESVFWLLPSDPTTDSVEDNVRRLAKPLADAVTRQNVKRLVYVAGLGHRENSDAEATGRLLDELIEKTGVDSRVLRMPAFMENLLWQAESIKRQGMFFYPVDGDRKLPSCATRDIADAAARLLLDGSWTGQDYVPVLGPEDLSYNDMAGIISEVTGTPVRYQQVPAEAYKANLMKYGMAEASAEWLVNLLTAIDGGLYNTEPRTPQATTPTSFRQFCEEVLKPAIVG
ncbi:NmrA family NAD(P)-binding protein [Streptomyces sp. SID10853]|uniref:NmrA family NAD(P)-binding protein n=1 Tax=Streptomyces sp. SID10853 TaxID=2706028 RepID=UPI0013C25F88|nr:NmrA family NAD(P)-binding protein [Streptomyces sp. SID10853]